MMRAAVTGAAGYVGGELIRLLIQHPHIELVQVSSRSQAGLPVSEVHPDLLGWTDLTFTDSYVVDVDVLFIAMGHGKSEEYLEKAVVPSSCRVVDMSRDFRLIDDAGDFVYGLCELNRDQIKTALRIANPGCFATCIQLGLLPMASAKKLNSEIHVTAITGSTGAGQKSVNTTHFSWRNNNVSIYKPFTHQHLGEIRQSIVQLQPSYGEAINFIPMRGDFTRGIFASIYFKSEMGQDEAIAMYEDYYRSSPFVHISPNPLSVKEVVNTNNAKLNITTHQGKIRIESIIDNLLKGAAGQAIQNLNLMMGWEEKSGLQLKGSAF